MASVFDPHRPEGRRARLFLVTFVTTSALLGGAASGSLHYEAYFPPGEPGNWETAAQLEVLVLRKASALEASVEYWTEDDTAVAGSDYQAASGTLTFPPGQDSAVILVPLIDDTASEPSERLRIHLRPGAGIATVGPPSSAFIASDEGPEPPPPGNVTGSSSVSSESGPPPMSPMNPSAPAAAAPSETPPPGAQAQPSSDPSHQAPPPLPPPGPAIPLNPPEVAGAPSADSGPAGPRPSVLSVGASQNVPEIEDDERTSERRSSPLLAIVLPVALLVLVVGPVTFGWYRRRRATDS